MIDSDVAIIICSRGREKCLARLLSDLQYHLTPALRAGGLTCCIWVYAQGYSAEYLESLNRKFADPLAATTLVVIASKHSHTRIGEVVHTAIRAVHDNSQYKLAMLMDDDSVYYPNPVVCMNILQAE